MQVSPGRVQRLYGIHKEVKRSIWRDHRLNRLYGYIVYRRLLQGQGSEVVNQQRGTSPSIVVTKWMNSYWT